jgi:hypothetical protein
MHERAFVLFGAGMVALLAGMLVLGRRAPRLAEVSVLNIHPRDPSSR